VLGIALCTRGACIHGDVEATERVVREFVANLESLQIQKLEIVNGNGMADETESLGAVSGNIQVSVKLEYEYEGFEMRC